MKPRAFSVVIPSSADGECLNLAVGSTLRAAQGFDAEVIVVGDGITPNLASYPQCQVMSIPKSGISAALNAGVVKAKHEWIVRMDGDDVCHPRRFHWTDAFLANHPNVDVVGGAAVKFGAISPRWEPPPQSTREIREELLHSGYALAHPAITMKRNALLDVGGYSSEFDGLEDLDLWLRLLGEGGEIVGVDEPAVFYRVHAAQASSRTGDEDIWARLRRDVSAGEPCAAGCPGRLESFRASRAGLWSHTCPHVRLSAGPRSILVAADVSALSKAGPLARSLGTFVRARTRGSAERLKVGVKCQR